MPPRQRTPAAGDNVSRATTFPERKFVSPQETAAGMGRSEPTSPRTLGCPARDPTSTPVPLKLDRPPSLRENANAALFLVCDESAYMFGCASLPATAATSPAVDHLSRRPGRRGGRPAFPACPMSPARPPRNLKSASGRSSNRHDGTSLLPRQHQCSIVAVRPGARAAPVARSGLVRSPSSSPLSRRACRPYLADRPPVSPTTARFLEGLAHQRRTARRRADTGRFPAHIHGQQAAILSAGKPAGVGGGAQRGP